MNTLEVILPLRNPTAVIGQTVRSLATLTDRNFSVLISDNHSTKGVEFIQAAADEFRSNGSDDQGAQAERQHRIYLANVGPELNAVLDQHKANCALNEQSRHSG